MKKFLVFTATLFLSTLLAGLYGALHDQLSYTISPEYFTKFKYEQFGLETSWFGGDRPTVAVVGALATWWFGLFLGLIHAFVGLLQPTASYMRSAIWRGVMLTMSVAAVTGLLGLLYGYSYLNSHQPDWPFPDNLVDRASFIAVGSMHNFSYLGGLLGLVAGIIYQLKVRSKVKAQHRILTTS
ncbi:hypothetical protein [Hymenobacter sp.]|jgi:hypothetical protein|uniref:hypothetical protein n=1 Tax=Hymenobacter sp. TaxID=1898978 RepID=UPI002ED867CC